MRATLRRTLLGVVLGIVGGSLALMIALGRASLVGSGGRGPGLVTAPDAALAPSFLVAFGLGGALLGLLAPLRRTPLGAFVLGMIAAAGFVAAIFVGLAGPPAEWSRSTWWAVGIAALLVGAVLGGQLQPAES
jgi:peptidoglycan/LPS O-acetylase OafA/YrhL